MDSTDVLALTARSQRVTPVAAPLVVIDVGAFDELYRTEHEPMVRLAFLLTGDREAAVEAVHDAFVATYERWDKLDRPGGYLRTAVVNRCRDLGRRQRFRSSATVPERVTSPHGDDYLADAVAALPPKRRAAVVLRYYLDLSEADIAATLGVRPGTVKSLLSRGLAELKRTLADPAPTGVPTAVQTAVPTPGPNTTPHAITNEHPEQDNA